MSNKNKPQPRHAQISVQQAKFYQGIIPSSEEMEKYEQIQPGFADRILKLTENEGIHRRLIEKKIIRWSLFSFISGQVLAFLSVLVVSGLCYVALEKGYSTTAGWIAVSTLVAIAAVFVNNRLKQKS